MQLLAECQSWKNNLLATIVSARPNKTQTSSKPERKQSDQQKLRSSSTGKVLTSHRTIGLFRCHKCHTDTVQHQPAVPSEGTSALNEALSYCNTFDILLWLNKQARQQQIIPVVDRIAIQISSARTSNERHVNLIAIEQTNQETQQKSTCTITASMSVCKQTIVTELAPIAGMTAIVSCSLATEKTTIP